MAELSEESPKGFLNLSNGMEFYFVFRGIDTRQIKFRDNHMFESKLFSLCNALLHAVDRSYLTR